jgi:hypothetical protein
MAGKRGRPTKWKDEFVQQAIDYCDTTAIPFVQEFAYNIGVHKDTVYEWCKKYKGFSDAIKGIESKQELGLLKGSLVNKLNTTSAIFQLKCNHGYVETEKKKVDITSDGEKLNAGIFVDGGLKD